MHLCIDVIDGNGARFEPQEVRRLAGDLGRCCDHVVVVDPEDCRHLPIQQAGDDVPVSPSDPFQEHRHVGFARLYLVKLDHGVPHPQIGCQHLGKRAAYPHHTGLGP